MNAKRLFQLVVVVMLLLVVLPIWWNVVEGIGSSTFTKIGETSVEFEASDGYFDLESRSDQVRINASSTHAFTIIDGDSTNLNNETWKSAYSSDGGYTLEGYIHPGRWRVLDSDGYKTTFKLSGTYVKVTGTLPNPWKALQWLIWTAIILGALAMIVWRLIEDEWKKIDLEIYNGSFHFFPQRKTLPSNPLVTMSQQIDRPKVEVLPAKPVPVSQPITHTLQVEVPQETPSVEKAIVQSVASEQSKSKPTQKLGKTQPLGPAPE